MENVLLMCRSLATICTVICAALLHAQDNHYWTQQTGARATLMGGAASASTDDQAVLFYNPAAVRRTKSTGITASASFFYMQWLKAKDLNDLGIVVGQSSLDNAPKLLVGSFDPKGNERLRFSFGFVNNLFGRFEVEESAAVRKDIDPSRPGTEIATGFLNILATTREDLVGAGASYAIDDRSSIGFTLFASLFNQRYVRSTDLGLFADPDLNSGVVTLASNTVTERADLFNWGVVSKVGYFHQAELTKWGVTVTLPRLSSHYKDGVYYLSSTELSEGQPVKKSLLYGEDLPTAFHSPWLLDLGIETKAGTAVWAFRVGCASGVDPYDRISLSPQDDLIQGVLRPDDGSFRRVRSASKPVVNAGVGAQFRISPAADLLAGFRTDMNHLDRSALDRSSDITGTFSYWDLYHVSCGVDLHSSRAKLTAGLAYAFGSDTGAPQDLDALGSFFGGPDDVRFKTNFSQLGLTFGISYFTFGKGKQDPPVAP